jgi:hypothetical protein
LRGGPYLPNGWLRAQPSARLSGSLHAQRTAGGACPTSLRTFCLTTDSRNAIVIVPGGLQVTQDLITVIVFVVCFLATVRLGTSVLVYATMRMPAEPPLDRLGRLNLAVPAAISESFSVIEKMLADWGFVAIDDIIVTPNAVTSAVSRHTGVRRAFVEPSHREFAVAHLSFAKSVDAKWASVDAHVEFLTRLADGTALRTSNTPTFDLLPSPPGLSHYQLIGFTDPAVVHRVHRAMINRCGSVLALEPRITAEFGSDAIAYFRWASRKRRDHLVETGYFYRDARDHSLRPTLKGTVTLWKTLWPEKWWVSRRVRRAATRLVAESAGSTHHG